MAETVASSWELPCDVRSFFQQKRDETVKAIALLNEAGKAGYRRDIVDKRDQLHSRLVGHKHAPGGR